MIVGRIVVSRDVGGVVILDGNRETHRPQAQKQPDALDAVDQRVLRLARQRPAPVDHQMRPARVDESRAKVGKARTPVADVPEHRRTIS